jgi:hypothetical protein
MFTAMKSMKRIFTFILSLAVLTVSAQFQKKEEPTKWQTKLSKTEVKKGEIIELIFTADIIDGWYLYSSDFDKDLGPVVATFNFTPDASYELVGEINPIGAKSKTDNDIWMGTYTYFTRKAEFRQKVKILKDNPAIKIKLNAQACSDESGKCVPVIQQFTFSGIKVTAAAEQSAPETVPTAPDKNGKATGFKQLNPADYSTRLEYLKAEKAQLVKSSSKNDEVVVQLKEFVRKYGN